MNEANAATRESRIDMSAVKVLSSRVCFVNIHHVNCRNYPSAIPQDYPFIFRSLLSALFTNTILLM